MFREYGITEASESFCRFEIRRETERANQRTTLIRKVESGRAAVRENVVKPTGRKFHIRLGEEYEVGRL